MSASSTRLRRIVRREPPLRLIALRAHKLRAFLTIVGIVIGVWTVIAMVALVTGFNRSTMDAFSSFGTTLVQFQKFEPRFFGGGPPAPEEERNRRDLTIEDAEALARLAPSIVAVSPERYLWGGSKVKGNGKEANSPTVSGGNQNYLVCNNWTIKDGRNITDGRPPRHRRRRRRARTSSSRSSRGRTRSGKPITINGRRVQIVGTSSRRRAPRIGGSPTTSS